MAERGMPVRAALWLHETDDDRWNLWLVPSKTLTSQWDFYHTVVKVVAENRRRFHNFDPADVALAKEDHPAWPGLAELMKVRGEKDIELRNNLVNGFYIPEGILLDVNLDELGQVAE